jgi:DNA-binding transcriptional LysR family regulator
VEGSGGVELDIRQVRAFVAAARYGHFGRAAASLFLTQQALSKRVARLEQQVGRLFERGAAGVTLTALGERFLPAAQQLLDAAEHALATVRGDGPRALRIDVWGPIGSVESAVRAFAVEHPMTTVEISMRRNLWAALDALWRNELDVVLGNVAYLDPPLPDGLSSELVTFIEMSGLVQEASELRSADLITAEDLRRHGLCQPAQATRQEFAGFVAEYAQFVGAPFAAETHNSDLDGLVDSIPTDPDAVMLVPREWEVPPGRGLRLLSLEPTPFVPWYAVWRTASPHPLVHQLVRATSKATPRLDVESDGNWLPAAARNGR